MTIRQSPTVQRRRLGAELRHLREATGMTIERVAEALECSDSKISRIETGQVSATPRDVRDILVLYKVGTEQMEALIQIAREARQRGWWHAYSDVIGSPSVGFEAAAASIRHYGALLVPGLLQTMDYATAVIQAVRPEAPPGEVERRVEARMARQKILAQANAPSYAAILDEAAVRRLVGGTNVMRGQIGSLMEAAHDQKVTLQVLLFAAGEHPSLDGSLTLLQFSDESDPDVVFFETPTRSELYTDGSEEVGHCIVALDQLSKAALNPKDSVAFLAELTEEL